MINSRSMAGASRRTNRTDVHLTPPWLMNMLPQFDLDPCAPAEWPMLLDGFEWPHARKWWSKEVDGLQTPWPEEDYVWMNPPYGDQVGAWLEKMAKHPGGGMSLVFARTETEAWQEHVWNAADLVTFINRRLTFCDSNGMPLKNNGGAPSALVSYGARAKHDLIELTRKHNLGTFVKPYSQ